jgi:hypothetical protein
MDSCVAVHSWILERPPALFPNTHWGAGLNTLRQVANLEAACDRYRLQEEEWQSKLNQSDGQARVILVMSEQVIVLCPPIRATTH